MNSSTRSKGERCKQSNYNTTEEEIKHQIHIHVPKLRAVRFFRPGRHGVSGLLGSGLVLAAVLGCSLSRALSISV